MQDSKSCVPICHQESHLHPGLGAKRMCAQWWMATFCPPNVGNQWVVHSAPGAVWQKEQMDGRDLGSFPLALSSVSCVMLSNTFSLLDLSVFICRNEERESPFNTVTEKGGKSGL